MTRTPRRPAVTIIIPTYDEGGAIDACLEAVTAQTYERIVEVLVVDGRSRDDTRARASVHPRVEVLDNPARVQAAALNVGIAAAQGEVIVRVDGHCRIAVDYVECCIDALLSSGATMVGGAMTPRADGPRQAGIAAAMASRFGAGPARFHVGGPAGWVDTVYLGAYWTEAVRKVGGYAEDVGVNEDAELAHRIGGEGGVWFDPSIRSTYEPRGTLRAVARQFYRYGRSRSLTARRHPSSISIRQLLAPALVIGSVSPARRWVLRSYLVGWTVVVAAEARSLGRALPWFAAALPVMHMCWGTGFLVGAVLGPMRFGAYAVRRAEAA